MSGMLAWRVTRATANQLTYRSCQMKGAAGSPLLFGRSAKARRGRWEPLSIHWLARILVCADVRDRQIIAIPIHGAR